jgi:hypothetical protein
VVQALFDAWWEEKNERVLPEMLIKGDELMQVLMISPGPQVGYLLEAIREAQINHDIRDKDGAIALAQRLLQEIINKKMD